MHMFLLAQMNKCCLNGISVILPFRLFETGPLASLFVLICGSASKQYNFIELYLFTTACAEQYMCFTTGPIKWVNGMMILSVINTFVYNSKLTSTPMLRV